MLTTLETQGVAFLPPIGPSVSLERTKVQSARVGELRRIGEILPMVLARLDEEKESATIPVAMAREVLVAIQLSPCQSSHCLV